MTPAKRAPMPNPDRPEPVFAAAWKPGLIVCALCTPLLKLVGEADKTCDGCGHACAGVDVGDGICTVTVMLSALSYAACLPAL